MFKDIDISQSRKWLRDSKMVHMLGKNEKKKMKEKEKQDIPTTKAYLLGNF